VSARAVFSSQISSWRYFVKIDSVMNNEEFLQRLSEVSEWHRPQCGPNGAVSVNKRAKSGPQHPGTVTEAELAAMDEDEITEYYERLLAWREAQPNASVPPEIKRVKIQAVDCEDCGRHCPQGRRTERKLYESGTRHWREFCTECELFKSPVSGLYEIPKLGNQQFFNSYHRPKLGVYASKYQTTDSAEVKPRGPRGRPRKALTRSEIVEGIRQEGDWIIRETDESITKFFVPRNTGLD
jgi:hypothetical protein